MAATLSSGVRQPSAATKTSTAMESAKSKPKRYRVMIVDDHPVVRHGLGQTIASDPQLEICGEASNSDEALATIEDLLPDVIVVDITLGGSNGLELIKHIKSRHPKMKMLVASMHDERLYAERALRAGALGYINKQEAIQNVVEAIHQILQGTVYVSQDLAEQMLQRVVQGDKHLSRSPIESLSDRELEVFGLIGEGLTTREVAERLHLSPKTVETHRDHIKAKLNVANNNELVRQAVEWTLGAS